MNKHIITTSILSIILFSSCAPAQINELVPGVSDSGISWGNSKADVLNTIKGEAVEIDGNLFYLNNGSITTYGFSNDGLSSVISLREKSTIYDSYLSSITASYDLVGNISQNSMVYINEKTNSLLQLRDITIMEEPYLAFISVPYMNNDSTEDSSFYTVSTSKKLITLGIGGSKKITASVSPKTAIQQIDWTSKDPSVAIVEDGVVYAKSIGETDIVATSMYEASAVCHVSVVTIPDTAVDMGDGVYWARKNYGASSIDEVGEKIEWASSEVSKTYLYGHSLTLQDDPIFIKTGGVWRTPNKTEVESLIKNCTWSTAFENGIKGRKVRAPNGNEIFMPNTVSQTSTNKRGFYWTSTAKSDYFAYVLFFATSGDSYDPSLISTRDESKSNKNAVRPVLYLQEE